MSEENGTAKVEDQDVLQVARIVEKLDKRVDSRMDTALAAFRAELVQVQSGFENLSRLNAKALQKGAAAPIVTVVPGKAPIVNPQIIVKPAPPGPAPIPAAQTFNLKEATLQMNSALQDILQKLVDLLEAKQARTRKISFTRDHRGFIKDAIIE